MLNIDFTLKLGKTNINFVWHLNYLNLPILNDSFFIQWWLHKADDDFKSSASIVSKGNLVL
jgi:hypothetical protein